MSEAVFAVRVSPYVVDLRSQREDVVDVRSQREIPLQRIPSKYSWRPLPRLVEDAHSLGERIGAARASANIDAECAAIADAAMKDAVQLVSYRHLEGVPRIMFSGDGILTIQWQRGDFGVALIFVGEGQVSIGFRRPGQLYAENGLDIGIYDELPSPFVSLMADIVR
jgi:hypothetical protein